MLINKSTIAFGLAASLLMNGCSNQPQAPVSEPAPAPLVKAEEPLPAAPFSQDSLYALMVAEMAGRRGDIDLALRNYLEQAQQTRDLGIVTRTTQIARQLRRPIETIEAVELWLELEPNSAEALFIASTELLNAKQYLRALEHSITLERAHNQPLYLTIASRASADNDITLPTLAERMAKLLAERGEGDDPANAELITARAIALQRSAPEQSLQLARRAQQLDPEFITAAIVEAKTLQQLERTDEARRYLQKKLDKHPNNKRLRLQYARLLAYEDLPQAERQFADLHQQYPKDKELQLAYALVLYELGKADAAEAQFNELLDHPKSYSMANYYLGRIAMGREQPQVALGYFNEVEVGNSNYLPAWVFRSDILVQQGQIKEALQMQVDSAQAFPELASRFLLVTVESLNRFGQRKLALELLNRGLEQEPDNRKLRYTRALSLEKQGQYDAMEADFRHLLKLDPEDASALNALGYTLASRGQRLQEAEALIKHAYQLDPQDPAIIDSMGWISYLQGRLEDALDYLRRAMSIYPDPEIAAHLGEVLWQLGQRQEALKVWRQGLELEPQSKHITTTMERLKASFEP
ncbi:MAG: tetratricopeptide repeat protein [Cellvibrionaceae bacterium]|nr:tetratricopeptide repeat protein [Cellvibrionaceae bacterium]